MIIVFDLDDTLYEEMTFVRGGMLAVANFLKEKIQEKESSIYDELIHILKTKGRNKIFDNLLLKKNKYTKLLVSQCVNTYRYHCPIIKLYPEAKEFLKAHQDKPLYLVTDGHKIVQSNKVKSLNLEKYFKKIFITHRYGIKNSKPSLYCFEKIKKLEQCNWDDLVYIGDNPNKDFISLNKVNAKTIRLLKGNYSDIIVTKKFEARKSITSLKQLNSSLKEIFK